MSRVMGKGVWSPAFMAALVLSVFASLPATAGDIQNMRVIEIPGSEVAISVWDEAAGSRATAWYAIAFDGESYTAPVQTNYDLLLWYQEFDPLTRNLPQVETHLQAGADSNVYIVQFWTQPLEVFQQQIEALGGAVNRYVPQNALVVTVPPAALQSVAAWPHVRWIGKYEPAYRLDPTLRAALSDPGRDSEEARYSIEVMQRGAAQQAALQDRIEALGGTVHFITPEGFRMEATLTQAALLDVVRADEVNFVDYWGGPVQEDMNYARRNVGSDADYIRDTLGFKGEGVWGEILDSGVLKQHQAFFDIKLHWNNGSPKDHGTSCYGIVYGNGAWNPNGTGMLPGQDTGIFGYATQLTQFGGWITRHQHTSELVDPNGQFRAVFQSSSVGSTQTTAYTSISAEVDDYLFLYDLLSCQSQSNVGNQNSRPQAWAKNIVGVGGTYHWDNFTRADDRWNSGASIGPASDGRVKPDLMHFYDSILCPTDTSSTAYTSSFGGTSAATPITAGAFGLLFQMWHEGIWAGHGGGVDVFDSRPHMATAKALMINAAYQYPLPGMSGYTDHQRFRQGWGMAHLKNLHLQAAKSFIIDETDVIKPLETKSYKIKVDAGEPQLKITLAYTDPAGNPAIQSQHRVNDLTLKVIRPDNQFYYGNNGLTTAHWSALGGSPDTKNTVENVFVQNPPAGTWTVEVNGAEIVQDAHPETAGVIDADYALIVTGATGSQYAIGDLNCDGNIDFGDINPFVLALSDPAGYAVQYPDCDRMLADINEDGKVDFGDINPFVDLLTQP